MFNPEQKLVSLEQKYDVLLLDYVNIDKCISQLECKIQEIKDDISNKFSEIEKQDFQFLSHLKYPNSDKFPAKSSSHEQYNTLVEELIDDFNNLRCIRLEAVEDIWDELNKIPLDDKTGHKINENLPLKFYYRIWSKQGNETINCHGCNCPVLQMRFLKDENNKSYHLNSSCVSRFLLSKSVCYVNNFLKTYNELQEVLDCGFELKNINGFKPSEKEIISDNCINNHLFFYNIREGDTKFQCDSCDEMIIDKKYLWCKNLQQNYHIKKECLDKTISDLTKSKCHIFEKIKSDEELQELIQCGFLYSNLLGKKPRNNLQNKTNKNPKENKPLYMYNLRKEFQNKLKCEGCDEVIKDKDYLWCVNLKKMFHIKKECLMKSPFEPSNSVCRIFDRINKYKDLEKILKCNFSPSNIIGKKPTETNQESDDDDNNDDDNASSVSQKHESYIYLYNIRKPHLKKLRCEGCQNLVRGDSYLWCTNLKKIYHIKKDCLNVCEPDLSKSKCRIFDRIELYERIQELIDCGFYYVNILGEKPSKPDDLTNRQIQKTEEFQSDNIGNIGIKKGSEFKEFTNRQIQKTEEFQSDNITNFGIKKGSEFIEFTNRQIQKTEEFQPDNIGKIGIKKGSEFKEFTNQQIQKTEEFQSDNIGKIGIKKGSEFKEFTNRQIQKTEEFQSDNIGNFGIKKGSEFIEFTNRHIQKTEEFQSDNIRNIEIKKGIEHSRNTPVQYGVLNISKDKESSNSSIQYGLTQLPTNTVVQNEFSPFKVKEPIPSIPTRYEVTQMPKFIETKPALKTATYDDRISQTPRIKKLAPGIPVQLEISQTSKAKESSPNATINYGIHKPINSQAKIYKRSVSDVAQYQGISRYEDDKSRLIKSILKSKTSDSLRKRLEDDRPTNSITIKKTTDRSDIGINLSRNSESVNIEVSKRSAYSPSYISSATMSSEVNKESGIPKSSYSPSYNSSFTMSSERGIPKSSSFSASKEKKPTCIIS